jgi:glycosyltransferase involved in cell wall biosynthesis
VPGVNVVGYLRAESGLGAAARGYIRALESLRVPLALCDVSELSSHRCEDDSSIPLDHTNPHPVNLICVNADQHFNTARYLGRSFLENRYNIGVWAWELATFPPAWKNLFPHYQELWAGTSFVANAIAASSPSPVLRIPPVLAEEQSTSGSRAAGRRRLNVGDEFLFSFAFDFHSFFERKNPLAIIKAFKAAFAPDEPVRLVIKAINGSSSPVELQLLHERAAGHPIQIVEGHWARQDIRDFMAACDCYVSLHRSEGTGLTISDAMSIAKPVIATGWSGNMDFMTTANSYPVNHTLVPLTQDHGPYKTGELWADPSVEHAAELMRHVFTNRNEAERRGLLARRDIQSRFSREVVGQLIAERLRVIAGSLPPPSGDAALTHHGSRGKRPPRPTLDPEEYALVATRMRAAILEVIPESTTLAVISRGDAQLLAVERREAWHFPRGDDGNYAGFHPANSGEAIACLEEVRKQGADYLVIPETAGWWLDHYNGFSTHLHSRYRRISHRHEGVVIFDLKASSF